MHANSDFPQVRTGGAVGVIRESGRYVYALYFSSLANVITPFARLLGERAGLETVLICYRRGDLPNSALYDFDESEFAEIVELDPILKSDKSIGSAQAAQMAEAAAEIERRYGFRVTELIRTDRHVGIGWVTSVQFPQSEYGRDTSYLQSVDVVIRLTKVYEELISRRPPSAMFGVSSAVGPATLWQMLKSTGVQTRVLSVARSGPALFWSRDEYMHPEGFAEAYREGLCYSNAEGPSSNVGSWLASSVRAQTVLNSIGMRTDWIALAKQIYSALRKFAGNRLFRTERVYGKYRIGQQLRIIIERHLWRRRITRERATVTNIPEDLPFVFFPLQVEPEATLMLESPMCDNQLTAIDWLAKTVPGGWYVVVKEHPGATAPKMRAFWQILSKYPNVILAKTLDDARAIAERSHAVAVLNGSLGVQAATVGKPVITFHPKFIARYMPHVLFADSYEATRVALEKIRDDILPPMSQRIRAANAFLYALDKCQFAVSDPQILSGVSAPRKQVIRADVEAIARSFLASLANERQQVNAGEFECP